MNNFLYTIYMPWVARELQARGFKIIRIEPSKKNPQLNVYLFEDTPALQAAMHDIIKKTN